MEDSKVLQDWFRTISFKMQSVVISAQRGPDTHHCKNIKSITKWIRRNCQINADTSHSFMEERPLPTFEQVEKEIEFCTVHYVLHLLHGLEIIGYKHPETEVRKKAMYFYTQIAGSILHLTIETEAALNERLADVDVKNVDN
jgi:hypothetical protein